MQDLIISSVAPACSPQEQVPEPKTGCRGLSPGVPRSSAQSAGWGPRVAASKPRVRHGAWDFGLLGAVRSRLVALSEATIAVEDIFCFGYQPTFRESGSGGERLFLTDGVGRWICDSNVRVGFEVCCEAHVSQAVGLIGRWH